MIKKWHLLFLLLFILSFHPNKSFAESSLQERINSLEEGAVLKLEGRTYEGNIVIKKTITLIGTKGTIIKGDQTGNVIEVRAPKVTLKNLTVTNSSMNRNSSEEFAAIKVYTNGNTLENLTVKNSFHGIYLSQAHHNTIRNAQITGLHAGQIANQGNGLHIYYSNSNLLENNQIEGTRDGVFFDYANENLVKNNVISHTRYGLHYMYSHHNNFEGNTFTMNTGGAAIMNSNFITLKDNQFLFNYGHRSFGVLLQTATDNIIENNIFYLNQRGLYLDQTTNNLIKNNRIMKNQIGIELWASSNKQKFTQNHISENTIPVVVLGGKGVDNHWNVNKVGNNWGDSFPVVDLNQDGIGDNPVTYRSSLFQLLEDQELTYLFLKSPAIPFYEKMSELLQKNNVMFEDHYPTSIKRHSSNMAKWALSLIGLVFLLILFKGRHRLCTMFGKNGKKA